LLVGHLGRGSPQHLLNQAHDSMTPESRANF
jgi:hypothetical protein